VQLVAGHGFEVVDLREVLGLAACFTEAGRQTHTVALAQAEHADLAILDDRAVLVAFGGVGIGRVRAGGGEQDHGNECGSGTAGEVATRHRQVVAVRLDRVSHRCHSSIGDGVI
jgi:hypothetical protein